jgi:hypothetical protein
MAKEELSSHLACHFKIGPNGKVIYPQPTNPQEALASSVQIKDTSPRRISVDPKTGEFVQWYTTKTIDDVFTITVVDKTDLDSCM